MRLPDLREAWAMARGRGDPDSARARTARLMLAVAAGQAISLAVSPLLTRLFPPAAWGIFGVYLAALGSLSTAASWRLGIAVALPESDDEAVAVVGAGLFASLVSALLAVVVLAVAGRWIAGDLLRAPAAYATLWLVPLGMFGAGVADVLSGWCLRHRSFDALVRLRVSRSVGIAAGQVVTAFLTRASAVGLALGDAAGRVYSAVEMGLVVRRAERARGGRFTWAATKAALWRYREFPFVSAPSTMINAIGLWAPVFLLTYWWGPVASGLFVVGQRVIGVPIGLLGDSAGQVYISELAARSRTSRETMPALFAKTARALLLVGLVPMLAMATLSPVVFRLVFGAEWTDAGVMVQWQSLALLAQLVAIPLAHTLLVLQHQRRQLGWDVARFALTVGGFWWAHRSGMDAIAAVAVYSGVTAVTYGLLIVLSWHAVGERAGVARGDSPPAAG